MLFIGNYQGFRECVPNQKARGLHFVTQNAYLAKPMGSEREPVVSEKKEICCSKQNR